MAFVGHQQIVHIVRMLFLDDENPREHGSRPRITIREISNQLLVMLDRDALGYQILLDHVDQIARRAVFGR